MRTKGKINQQMRQVHLPSVYTSTISRCRLILQNSKCLQKLRRRDIRFQRGPLSAPISTIPYSLFFPLRPSSAPPLSIIPVVRFEGFSFSLDIFACFTIIHSSSRGVSVSGVGLNTTFFGSLISQIFHGAYACSTRESRHTSTRALFVF